MKPEEINGNCVFIIDDPCILDSVFLDYYTPKIDRTRFHIKAINYQGDKVVSIESNGGIIYRSAMNVMLICVGLDKYERVEL